MRLATVVAIECLEDERDYDFTFLGCEDIYVVSHTQSEHLPSKEYGGHVISLVSAPWAPQKPN
jgi:hypothetical protein